MAHIYMKILLQKHSRNAFMSLFFLRVLLGDLVFAACMKIVGGYAGLTVYSYFAKLQCDPIASGQVTSPNKVDSEYTAPLPGSGVTL